MHLKTYLGTPEMIAGALYLLGADRLAGVVDRSTEQLRIAVLLLRSPLGSHVEARLLEDLAAVLEASEGMPADISARTLATRFAAQGVEALASMQFLAGLFGAAAEPEDPNPHREFNPQPDPPGFVELVTDLVAAWREKRYVRALSTLRILLGLVAMKAGTDRPDSPDATLRAAVERWAEHGAPVSREDQRLLDVLIRERTRKATAYEVIRRERERQVAKGRDADHDDARSWQDWLDCIEAVLAKEGPLREQREATAVKLGSIAVAIYESLERAPHEPEQPEGWPT